MNAAAAAELLRCDVATVYNLEARGKLASVPRLSLAGPNGKAGLGEGFIKTYRLSALHLVEAERAADLGDDCHRASDGQRIALKRAAKQTPRRGGHSGQEALAGNSESLCPRP